MQSGMQLSMPTSLISRKALPVCTETHYGKSCNTTASITQKLVQVTNLFHKNSSSAVVCDQVITDHFEVKTGVKQGCILSPFLFILAVDWLLKTTTKGKMRGI